MFPAPWTYHSTLCSPIQVKKCISSQPDSAILFYVRSTHNWADPSSSWKRGFILPRPLAEGPGSWESTWLSEDEICGHKCEFVSDEVQGPNERKFRYRSTSIPTYTSTRSITGNICYMSNPSKRCAGERCSGALLMVQLGHTPVNICWTWCAWLCS